jgi:hypothetical protein
LYYQALYGIKFLEAISVMQQSFLSGHPGEGMGFFKPSLSPARTRFKEITHWAKIGFC